MRLPKAVQGQMRVLAAKDLFECLELCLTTDRRAYLGPITHKNDVLLNIVVV